MKFAKCFLKFYYQISQFVYQFSTADVTNYHKISVVKQHKFIILQFCKSSLTGLLGLKSRCPQGYVFFQRLWVWSVSLTFVDSRGHLHSLALGPLPPSSEFQRQVESSHHLSLTPFTVTSHFESLLPPSSHLRTLRIAVAH